MGRSAYSPSRGAAHAYTITLWSLLPSGNGFRRSNPSWARRRCGGRVSSVQVAAQLTEPPLDQRPTLRRGSAELTQKMPDEPRGVRGCWIIECLALITAAPRVSQPIDHYRAQQHLVAACIVLLPVPAAIAADVLFHRSTQRPAGYRGQLGGFEELSDDLFSIARMGPL